MRRQSRRKEQEERERRGLEGIRRGMISGSEGGRSKIKTGKTQEIGIL